MSHLANLERWIENERRNHGLVDIKLFPLAEPGNATVESLAREALAVLTAPSRPITKTGF